MKHRRRKAAITIQKHIKRYICQKAFVELIYKKYIKEVTPIVISIQKIWRKYHQMKIGKIYAFQNAIKMNYKTNAEKIADLYKSNIYIKYSKKYKTKY